MYKDLDDNEIVKRISFPFALKVSNIYDFGDDDTIRISVLAAELEFSNSELIGFLKLIVSKWDGSDYNHIFFKETENKESLIGKMNDRLRLNHFCDIFSYAYDKKMTERITSERYPLPNGAFRDNLEDLFVKINKYYSRFRRE